MNWSPESGCKDCKAGYWRSSDGQQCVATKYGGNICTEAAHVDGGSEA